MGFQHSAALGEAAVVVHVQVNWYKFVHDAFEDVEHAPLLIVDHIEVQFSNDLVKVVEVLYGKVS